MLNEPEQGVGQAVVHQVVGFLVVLDEDDLQVFNLVRLLAALFGDARVLLALGRGDPDGLSPAARDSVQGRDEAPSPTGILAPARLVLGEGHRSPVRDDNEPCALVRVAAALVSCPHMYSPRAFFQLRSASLTCRAV